MSESSARLILAADNYCAYLGGLFLVRREISPSVENNSLATVKRASEEMYSGLTAMADLAARERFGMSMSSLSSSDERNGADEELAAFAVEAVDFAYVRYGERIRKLGIFTLREEFLRPCPIKSPPHMYLARRTRPDKMRFCVLTHNLHDRSFAGYADLTLSDMRKHPSVPDPA